MKRLFAKLRNIIGTSVLLLFFVGILIGLIQWITKPRVPDRLFLEVDFEQEFVEHLPDDPLARAFLVDKADLLDTVETLERAGNDERVVALIGRIGADSLDPATSQKLRDAILAFREKGKKAIAHAETFGENRAANQAYYLASAFDEIYLQPSGMVGLTGLLSENVFLRGSLDKLGVVPRLDHREEYKSFKNLFTERQLTEAHEKAARAIVDSLFEQMVKGIGEGRKLSKQRVEKLFEQGPFLADEALRNQLIDGLSYRDEIYAKIREEFGDETKPLYLDTYSERIGQPDNQGNTIALVYGTGFIRRGDSGYDPVFAGLVMGSATVTAALRAAAKDQAVKAILFRINSGGGSYVASDSIWREVVRARQAGKPVVVSMGDVAGSGGYFVAVAADKIVAQPATLTGSIGVVGGKMVTSDFWEKLGVNWGNIATSANATFWSGRQDYTDEEWARLQTWLDYVYKDFMARVAKGHHLPLEQVQNIAKGRAWTGKDAKQLGLVDELGGFPVALRLARQVASLAADAPIRLKLFPEEKSRLRQLLEKKPASSEQEIVMPTLHRTLTAIQPDLQVLRDLGLLMADPQPLMMPLRNQSD